MVLQLQRRYCGCGPDRRQPSGGVRRQPAAVVELKPEAGPVVALEAALPHDEAGSCYAAGVSEEEAQAPPLVRCSKRRHPATACEMVRLRAAAEKPV